MIQCSHVSRVWYNVPMSAGCDTMFPCLQGVIQCSHVCRVWYNVPMSAEYDTMFPCQQGMIQCSHVCRVWYNVPMFAGCDTAGEGGVGEEAGPGAVRAGAGAGGARRHQDQPRQAGGRHNTSNTWLALDTGYIMSSGIGVKIMSIVYGVKL